MQQRPRSTPAPPGVSLQSVVPVLLFLGVNRLAGLRWAVVVATIWSVKLLVERRRNGVALGVFMPIVTAAVLIRGAIGAITGSETLYFGLGIATKYLVATVLVASIAARKPLARYGAPYVLARTEQFSDHKRFQHTMVAVTAIGALYYLLSATVDVWLFRRNDVEGFVLWRLLANWPLSALALGAIAGVAHAQLTKIPGILSLPALVEERMALYGADDTRETPPSSSTRGSHPDETAP